jgi:hypothetical protein
MNPPSENIVVTALTDKYFSMLSLEDYPNTPEITKQLDNIEKALREINGSESGSSLVGCS